MKPLILEQIIAAIAAGHATVPQIMAATKLTRDQVRNTLQKLRKFGVVASSGNRRYALARYTLTCAPDEARRKLVQPRPTADALLEAWPLPVYREHGQRTEVTG